jgi:hypothetical protein
MLLLFFVVVAAAAAVLSPLSNNEIRCRVQMSVVLFSYEWPNETAVSLVIFFNIFFTRRARIRYIYRQGKGGMKERETAKENKSKEQAMSFSHRYTKKS